MLNRRLLIFVALLLFVSSPVRAAEPAGAPSAAGRARLPQSQPYQKQLRAFLGTLTEADFLPAHKDLTVVPLTGDADEQFRTWVLSLSPPAVGRKRNYSSVMVKPADFTLDSIEGAASIMRPSAHPEPLVDLANWNYPGNPYFNSRPLRLRAFVMSALDLIMLDNLIEGGGAIDAGGVKRRLTLDQLADGIGRFAYTYPGVREVLPAEVRDAYLTGLKQLVRRALDRGPDGYTMMPPGIYTRTAPALYMAAKVINDPEITQAVEADARRLFTEERFFRPAGYFPHGGTLDSFNGMSSYYALWAALASDWPFAREALARLYRLQAHLTLPEPDGVLVGPSHMASLTSAEPVYDQWGSPMRLWAAALITDEAACLTMMPTEGELQMGPAAAVGEVNFRLRELSLRPGGLDPAPWKLESPGMLVNFAYEYYPTGYHGRRIALEKQPDLVQLPVLRATNFVRAFGDEFVVAKTPTHAAIIHTGPIADPAETNAAHGFGGGALSVFWTRETGSVILGRGIGAWSPRYKTMFDDWRSLPAHAVMGLTADGKVFTSAHIVKPDTTVESSDGNYTITARGVIPQTRASDEKLLSGVVEYTRKFASTAAGVSIATSVTADGQDTIAELYEVLPVFLREASRQPKATPTVIEFKAEGKWISASETCTEKVTAARLIRFSGAVEITFDRPCRAKLAPGEWSDTYQSRAACRNILIDLLDSGDKIVTLKDTRQISYRIEAVAK